MPKPKPTPTNDKLQAVVKISFVLYNRSYEVGIARFLQAADIDATDEQLENAAKKILSQT